MRKPSARKSSKTYSLATTSSHLWGVVALPSMSHWMNAIMNSTTPYRASRSMRITGHLYLHSRIRFATSLISPRVLRYHHGNRIRWWGSPRANTGRDSFYPSTKTTWDSSKMPTHSSPKPVSAISSPFKAAPPDCRRGRLFTSRKKLKLRAGRFIKNRTFMQPNSATSIHFKVIQGLLHQMDLICSKRYMT